MMVFVLRWVAAVAIAFVVGKLVSKIKLPSILGWLIAGMILGPYALSLIPANLLHAEWYQAVIHVLECAVGLMIGTVWESIDPHYAFSIVMYFFVGFRCIQHCVCPL